MSDAVLLIIYLTLNNFIWTHGSVFWCTLPKIAWSIALYFYFPDRVPDLATAFSLSLLLNTIHVMMCENMLVAVHRGAKGRHCRTRKYVENIKPGEKNQFYEEHLPMILPPICYMNPVEFFISINLDISNIRTMLVTSK